MKRNFSRISVLILIAILLFSSIPFASAETAKDVTILFTHDLHSHFLPSVSESGEYGGYARLATLIREQRALDENALLLDGGDFSMGSLFQTAYTTSALELRMLGAMGYDATTFGNHEFDYLPEGLSSMLRAAVASGEPLPALVDANYLPPADATDVWDALNAYGVQKYILLERGGVYFAIFGLTGYDSDDCAPNSGMILEEPAAVARAIVDEATAACLAQYGVEPIVIALSHSGTDNGKGEDYELAKKVDGIDVIISAHTHTELKEPIMVNGTCIVSAGEYGKNLGVLKLSCTDHGVSVRSYELLRVDETVAEDAEIAALVENYKEEVEKNYLSDYGMEFDEVLLNNPYSFESVRDVYATQHESPLGDLFSDAYKWAVEEITGETVDVALTASGVIRESIPLGNVTVSDIFNSASLGVGTEGELVLVYLTGEDLKTALEVDASVYPLMNAAQLFCSGVEYSFNTSRMIFNKVDHAMLQNADGTLSEIEDEKLYRVTCGMYIGQMLGSVKDTSFGLISITPRTENGEPIAANELVNYVVHDESGTAVKEWYAIASYLQQMGGTMDAKYASTDGRKTVYSSLNPVKLFSNANIFTHIALRAVLVLVAVIALVAAIVHKKKAKRNG